MKRYFDFLFLLLPVIVWSIGVLLLQDQFCMPNRLILAVLCTATGAGALLIKRKMQGAISLVAGIMMLASVPVEHEIPQIAFTIRLSNDDASTQSEFAEKIDAASVPVIHRGSNENRVPQCLEQDCPDRQLRIAKLHYSGGE